MAFITYQTHPQFFGYFDQPGQPEPTYDPGVLAPCLICGQPWTPETVRTIGFVEWDAELDVPVGINYFYRVHKACHDDLGDKEVFENAIAASTTIPNTN